MAKKKQKLNNAKLKSTSKIDTDVFAKGMTKDPDAPFTGKDQWTHARNAINNSDKGDVGALGNEPANLLCTYTNYPVIGTVYLYGDKWILYSTDDTTSEIGIFDDSECTYTVLVNDGTAGGCLNFKRSNLITGASKENFDCTWQVYWDDGLNPTRTLNIQNIPWVQQQITGPEIDGSDCITFENIEPLRINCEALRIAPFRDTPRISLQKSDSGGQLRNGSYQVFLAYSVDDQKIGDWIGISNVQALWSHEEMAGSLDIIVDGIDTGYFEEFKLCLLSNNQQEQRAKEIGTYDIYTKNINIDYVNEELPTVPLETLPLATPVYEKSDKMYVVNDYLVRQGPTEKFDFNYQPLANQIETWWINTRFPADYYKKGGNKPTFMRDEVYSFFIRWIYKDGEKSSSYHIPGRYHGEYAIPPGYTNILDTTPITDPNNLTINAIGVSQEALWQSYNTAPLGGYGTIDGGYDPINNPNYPGLFRTDDGGVITQYGAMGYWQSSEKYPNDPIRWNAGTGNPAHDLCNTPIRHHKFPDEQLSAGIGDSGGPANAKFLSRSSFSNQVINILGVKFANIHLPRMNPPTAGACETVDETADPELVPNIVGYEILVGSRDGNKSIIAKGLARNMRGHRLPPDSAGNESSESFGDIRGVHANYPFNDLGCDPYLHDPWPPNNGIYRWPYNSGNANAHGGIGVNIPGKDSTHKWAYRDMFTFHSPDTSFNRPYLSPFELKSYGVTQGKSIGRHLKSEKHPQQKLLNDAAAILSIIFGAGYAVQKLRGGSSVDFDYPQPEIPAPGVGVPAAPTNFTALLTQQGTAAVTESAHTASALGAPKLGTQTAIGLNTASGLIVTPQMWAGYARGGFTASYNRDKNWFSELPAILQPFYGVIAFMQSAAEGGNHIFELIYNLCSYTDYAFKYNSHGLYWDTMKFKDYEPHRTKIIKARYVKNTIQNLTSTVKMNNLFRPSTVAIITEDENQASSRVLPTSDIIGSNDNSRVTIQNCYYPNYLFTRHIAAHYCALKLNFDNQYGQVDTIKQIPIANGERGGGTQYIQDQLQILYTPTSNTTSIPPIGVDDDVITEFAGPSGDLSEPIDGDSPGPGGISQPFRMPLANDQQPILNEGPYGRNRMRAGDALIMPSSLQAPNQSTFIDVSEDRDPSDPGVLIVPDINTTLMSDTLYGGDCYIARYTEKVTMPLFWDFLVGQPDGFPYDYRLRSNIMFPMFWANFHRYDLSTLTQYITSFAWFNTTPQQFGAMPSGFHHLDRCDGGIVAQNLCVVPSPVVWDSGINSIGADGVGADSGPGDWEPEFDDSGWFLDNNDPDYDQPPENLDDAPTQDFDWNAGNAISNPTSFTGTPTGTPDFSTDDGYDNRRKGLFMIKDGYFYTHVNGVNDFFVETPMNIALRDWEDQEGKRHYDWLEFTDVNELFHANIQAHGNFYKYDQSLQIEKIVTHRISHGSIQPRYYDPHVAETCFTHYPKRLQYSLQAHKEAVKDYWRVYLPNNYKDFKNKVNVIKPISKSGAMILFPHLAPVMWQGVDTLQTDLGTKITIGDGGLFSQPQQNIVNADLAHEYGSCESSRSVINTPSGLYYISQAQGKIFQMSGKGLVNIADAGMKQWFNEYLPSNLIKQFPELEHCTIWSDNPVVGVGCQSVYDPNYDLVYFMKRDYNCISECIDFVPCEGFFYNQTRCDGVIGEPCCEEGFIWNEEFQECINLYTVPPITPELECPILVDIMISVDHSASIRDNNNIENVEAFIADLGYGFFDELEADDVRISVMEWTDQAPGSSQSYGGPFDNSADVASFPYGNGAWGSTSPPVGFWYGLNRLYNDGRAGVPKVLILVMDGYDASPNACLNNVGQDTLGFDCNICNGSINNDPDPATFVGGLQSYSEGWSSPGSSINTPAMVNIRSDNPGEPGNLDFYIGNNEYGIYAHNPNTSIGDIPLISFNQFEVVGTWDNFPGPYSKPDFGYWAGYGNGIQTGCIQSDNFIDWLNTNIFDPTSQYQDPNHPDFDGELKVWGIWFAPWNGESFTSTNITPSTMDWNDPNQVIEYNEECWTGSITSGLNPYRYDCSNHPFNGQQITQGNIDYTIARSTDINHALWGNIVDQATIDGMVQQILDITCEEYGEPYCPDDCPNSVLLPTNIFSPDQPSWICACIEYGELDSTADARIPVEVSNSDYFEDVSWTVSYDPKAKAWISFHDWHPELAMPSLRHFLTTKTIADGPETCPPGTTLNPVTGMCEAVYTFTYPAEVTILEQQPVYNDNWETSTSTEIVENACPWDIVFSVDNSSSTTSGGPGVWNAQLGFIDSFVSQITDAMNAGTIQVGIRFWDGNTNCGPNAPGCFDNDINDVSNNTNYRIDLTTDASAVRDFLGYDAWTGDSGCASCLNRNTITGAMTNYMAAMNGVKRGLDVIFDTGICDMATDADTGLPTVNTSVVGGITYGDNNQGNSWVGSRHQDPNFTRFGIIISDSASTSPVCALQNALGPQNALNSGGAVVNSYFWAAGDQGLHRVVFDGLGNGGVTHSLWQYGQEYGNWIVNGPGNEPNFDNNVQSPNPIFNIKTMAVKSGIIQDNNYLDGLYVFLHEYYLNGQWSNICNNGAGGVSPTVDYAVTDGLSAFNVWSGPPPNFEQPAQDVLDNLSCNFPVTTTTNNDDPDTCICADPTYTQVYWDANTFTYSLPEGNCRQGSICRKIECLCDDSGPVEGIIPVVIGDCPDVYQAGIGVEFDNPNPPICQISDITAVPPSTLGGSIWKHNIRCDLFANYYEQDYPWEIEWVEAIGQQVATVRSVEYQQESYVYNGNLDNNCGDRFHDLDWNFDEAIIYNTEQVSGLLKLNLSPKNNVPLITDYPIVNATDIDILYSKEEQKYRFNQFWDTTADRGEFTNIQNSIFLTRLNGYIRDLNQANLNYNKSALERKKFRHYYNKVILRRSVSGDRKMILKLANTKINYSFR